MHLSPRLKTISDTINNFDSMADIGSDHAYLPIYLIKNGKIKNAIASDVNKGPVKIAKDRILSNNLTDSIEVKLGNGLEVLKKDEVDVIVIAGMGGILIKEILEGETEIARSAKMLILQPMRDSNILRKWLYKNEFHIVDEELVKEEHKFYEIMWVVNGFKKYDEEDAMIIGKPLIEKNHILLCDYIESKLKKIRDILQTLDHIHSITVQERFLELRALEAYYLEVLRCAKQNVNPSSI